MIKIIMKKLKVLVMVCVLFSGCESHSDHEEINISSGGQINKMSVGEENESSVEEQAYIDFMEQDEYANPKTGSGELSLPYAFFDIDGDGKNELIIAGGYISYQIYAYYNQQVTMIGSNKYGGDFTIYSNNHVFGWIGGHKDYYYEEYYKVTSSNAEMIAQKTWVMEPSHGKATKTTYQVHGKKSKKNLYDKTISEITKEKGITVKDLTWNNLKNKDQLDEIK